MNKIKETIRDYECLTAGRYYSLAQKKALFDLVSRANFLKADERDNLANVIFSSDVEEYKDETDCANGLLLMSVVKSDNQLKEILTCRKKILTGLKERRLWNSKDSWLRFMHEENNSFYAQFDAAIYSYSVDDVDKSIAILMPLVQNCHYLSVKLLIALYRELPNNQEEAKYLILLKRIREELYDEVLSEEFELRLKELSRHLSQKVVESVKNVKLKYFNENSNGMSRIGF